MNNIKATKAINEQELKLGIKASWHDDYKDSAYIYIGGLDTGLTEGDIITIFSQYGEPVDINLPKEKAAPTTTNDNNSKPNEGRPAPVTNSKKATKSRGRTLRVDHCKNYKQLEKNQEGKTIERDADLGERLNARPELHIQPTRSDDDDLDQSIDPEDPMAAYLLEERRKSKKKKNNNHESSSKSHKRRGDETEEERAARKDAKRIKKLLKEVGPSKTRDSDRRDNDRYDSRDGRRVDNDRYDSRDARRVSPRRDSNHNKTRDNDKYDDRSSRRDHDRYSSRDDRDYRRSDRDR
ncbi:hypothetical protein Pst134EA_031509 [Puccinia striiformis f. sp. tritici]|uniref:uncharacterized protein n=1 Tax=Puccinia striiformis f. sp. tritici TaxID=168172 RepID=UPI002007A5D1|nr:uncharacterized protein Pst134EA_031509 [Puccinia striiformis f. sp. tritici]KAH9445255.1 hypothetical protein Pst134EA_031509 [Puccinia striiformis f. sp. tritici]